jgi:hypothetical protein
MLEAIVGALGTIAAAFTGVLTWYLASRHDRRRELEERERFRKTEEAQREQRVLDIVVALHSEILAGVVANRRQLTPEDVEYALKQSSPFAIADETDFVFESLKSDISILPAEVIHSVVQYYRVALQSNLATKGLHDPYFLAQPANERRRIIAFLLQLVELQKILGEEAVRDLALYAARSGVDLEANERRAIALIERASGELDAIFKKSEKSVRKPLLPRAGKPSIRNIGERMAKEK